ARRVDVRRGNGWPPSATHVRRRHDRGRVLLLRAADRGRRLASALVAQPGRPRREEDCAVGLRWTPRYRVLGRPDSTTIGAPCVLASRRPSHPDDERPPAETSHCYNEE